VTDVNQSSTENSIEENNKGGLISSIITLAFWLIIVSAFLWNWDGFWQTDIKALNNVQKNFLPTKYSEEQLKTSMVTRNNNLIESIRDRLERTEERANRKLAKVIKEKDVAINKFEEAKTNLDNYLEKENTKCRYYDTSLRMIDLLTKKYSEDELKRVLSCTNVECEKILNYRQEALKVCG